MRWALLLAAVLAVASPVRAEEPGPGWGYLIDGGALPFFWGAGMVFVGTYFFTLPPNQPRLFPTSEGGEDSSGDTIPEYQMAIAVAAAPFLMAIPDREARLFHVKGIAEAILTTGAVSEIVKNSIGRHRPSYQEASDGKDGRKSFFSSHASLTLAATTYAGLYLHQHVFAAWREPEQSLAWWEVPPLAALVAASVYVPYTRVQDKRHHVSDVLVGASIGSVTAVAFYAYQEWRFRNRTTGGKEPERLGLMAGPDGAALYGNW